MTEERPRGSAAAVARGRCRCGHYPTYHMVTRPIAGTASFRLDPSGPCSVCGEATCRSYVPAGDPPSAR